MLHEQAACGTESAAQGDITTTALLPGTVLGGSNEFRVANPIDVLKRARLSYDEHYAASSVLAFAKRTVVQFCDVDGMERAAAICHWGRSGSLLLASYLDGHPQVVMLPLGSSESIYPFFSEYESLPVWEKLLAYPTYSATRTGVHGDFFLKDNPEGNFAIQPADYYAAVLALFERFGRRPHAWLEARATFFKLLHVAFAAAVGRVLANPRPMMIYGQHWFDQRLAEAFTQDFPRAQFVHTVRDPVSAVDSWLERALKLDANRESWSDAAGASADLLVLGWDRGHEGLEARTRAVRFEDLHLAPELIMRRLAEWLGIGYDPCLLRSTWNGEPYVVTARGVKWCGANPANAARRSRNLGATDRLLMLALMYDHLETWRYSAPRVFRYRWVRTCLMMLLSPVPTKMELVAARSVLRWHWRTLRSSKRGAFAFALRASLFLLKGRWRMMRLVAVQALKPTPDGRALMPLL